MTSERDVIDSLQEIHSSTFFSKKWEKVGPPGLRSTYRVLSGHFPLLHMFVLSCAAFLDHDFFTFPILRELFFCMAKSAI